MERVLEAMRVELAGATRPQCEAEADCLRRRLVCQSSTGAEWTALLADRPSEW